jgi:hypothetical protein
VKNEIWEMELLGLLKLTVLHLFSYVGYVVGAFGGTNAVAPVWPRRSDKQLHSLSPLYKALFIALCLLCTMYYLSLSILFVQCVIYR